MVNPLHLRYLVLFHEWDVQENRVEGGHAGFEILDMNYMLGIH